VRPDRPVRRRDVRAAGPGPVLLDAAGSLARVVRAGRGPAAQRPGGRRRRGRGGSRDGAPAGPGCRAGHHAASGEGPGRGVRRAGDGLPDPGARLVHALGGRVPAHAGVGHLGRHRDAAARRDDAAADAGRLGTGDGMALPGSAGQRRRGVRRAPGRRAAVLHAGDRHHRPRVGLQEPRSRGRAAGAGLQHPARPDAAAAGQGGRRAGVRGRCGACCSSTCPAMPASTSPTAAPTQRPTRC
jgi:translation initiation factor IF-2